MQIVPRGAELLLLWALAGGTSIRQTKRELVLAPSCLCCDTPTPHSSFAGRCKRSRDQLCQTAVLQQPPVLEFQVWKAHQCMSDSRFSIIYKNGVFKAAGNREPTCLSSSHIERKRHLKKHIIIT